MFAAIKMERAGKKVFEYTYGEYPVDDPVFGISMILVSLLPLIAPVVVLTIAIHQKSKHHFLFLMGLIVSHLLAKFLKKVWKQPRPAGAFLSNYGMPSDHSMFMFFITSYVTWSLARNPLLKSSGFVVTLLSMIVTSTVVGYSRLYLGVHTLEQVVVGGLLGVVVGSVWFWASDKLFLRSKLISKAFDSFHSCLQSTFYSTRGYKK